MTEPEDVPQEIRDRMQKVANRTGRLYNMYLGKDGKWHYFQTVHGPKHVRTYFPIAPELKEDQKP